MIWLMRNNDKLVMKFQLSSLPYTEDDGTGDEGHKEREEPDEVGHLRAHVAIETEIVGEIET